MNPVTAATSVNDVVILSIASNAFWLTVIIVLVVVFRSELRSLLSSLSSVSIAGSHFELGDKTLTLKSYTILSNIFLDVLANGANAEKLAGVFSEVNAQQLTKFTIKYLLEAPKEEINFTLIRNIAYIAGLTGRLQDSLSLYNFLLEKAPDDRDLKNNMAIVLLQKDPKEAAKVYQELADDNPGVPLYRYNLAIANIMMDNFDPAIVGLERVIREGYWQSDPQLFERQAIKKLGKMKPEEFNKLKEILDEEMRLAGI